jgi:BMFP domain-containing protein YqiC
MQTENRFFDDMARMAGGALNALTGLKTEMEAHFRQQMESFMGGMNLVSREEFEAVQALAAKAREEQEALAARLAALEEELAALKAKPAAKGKTKADQVTE